MAREISKKPESLTVREFFESFREALDLELVAGENGMNKAIREETINRPALALTGYFKYFAYKRIQLFGAGEMSYLRDLNADTERDVIREIMGKHIPCVIVSRNLLPTPNLRALANEYRVPLMRTKQTTRDFTTEATLLLESHFAARTTIHGTLLDVRGIGTLLRGKSGVGKSECALALIERGHSLVADDITYCRRVGDREVVGTSSELNRGYMECRGLGIINIAEMFGVRSVRVEKRIDLILTFTEYTSGMHEERTGLEQSFFEILDMKVPHMEIPVKPGRDMARLAEAAAMIQALRKIGHEPAKEFNERLIAHMAKKQS